MVQLILHSPKGNQGTRYFPYHGYLGLTPVRVEGAVRTKLDSDLKPALARSLTVAIRCYEARVGRLGNTQARCLVEQTQVLWAPRGKDSGPSTSNRPDTPEYAELGDSEHTFRIIMPAKVAGLSTANYPEYRVYWRVEAVLEHVHIPGVGTRQIKSFELPLVRHDVPPPLVHPVVPISPVSTGSSSSSVSLPFYQAATRGRMPILRYNVTVPSEPIGPQDFVSVPLSVQPLENGMTIRSATLIVERRMELVGINNSVSSLSTPPPPPPPPVAYPSPPSSSSRTRTRRPRTAPSSDGTLTPTPTTIDGFLAERDSATPTGLAHMGSSSWSSTAPSPSIAISASSCSLPLSTSDADLGSSQATLLQPSPIAAPSSPVPPSPSPSSRTHTVVTSVVASADSSGAFFARFAPSSSSSAGTPEVWSKTLTLQWPAARSTHRWAIGETARTEFAHTRFVARIRLVVSTPAGTETIELDGDDGDRELLVVSTNEAERRLALAKTDEAARHKKSKSQSPKRRPRESDGEQEPARDAPGRPQPQLPSPPGSPPTAPPGLWRSDANTSGSSASSDGSGMSSDTSTTLMAVPSPSMSAKQARPRATKTPSSKDRAPRASRVSRRPHTSAGPGDAPTGMDVVAQVGLSTGFHGGFRAPSRMDAGPDTDVWATTPRSSKDLRQSTLVSDREMRAWEEELARIEAVSQRSSANMLGSRRGAPVGLVDS